MSPKLWILLAGAGVVGGVVLLSSRSANASPLIGGSGYVPTTVQPSQADAAAKALAGIRALAGARAVSANGSAGNASLLNGVASGVNAKVSGVLGSTANKLLPGTGGFVSSVSSGVGNWATNATGSILSGAGSTVTSGLKKLKFW